MDLGKWLRKLSGIVFGACLYFSTQPGYCLEVKWVVV